MSAIEKARQTARKIIEKNHYDGLCTVREYGKVVNDETKITSFQEVVVLEDEPCHLAYKTINPTGQTESAAVLKQATELLISPDVTIKPGSKITITQAGVTEDYTFSGVPAVYPTHQQIMLDLFKGWS